ncbi:MAG: hypothetical protein ABSC08_01480 [Bryobacteraceae bacterium]|jgi:hypothetical protein
MFKRAILVLAIVGLTCSASLPLWALATCPMMDANAGAHSCCHRHPTPSSTPSTACVLHCSSSIGVLVKVQVPPQPGPAADAPVQAAAVHSTVAVAPVPTATDQFFDSSGLYLRDRVLRI